MPYIMYFFRNLQIQFTLSRDGIERKRQFHLIAREGTRISEIGSSHIRLESKGTVNSVVQISLTRIVALPTYCTVATDSSYGNSLQGFLDRHATSFLTRIQSVRYVFDLKYIIQCTISLQKIVSILFRGIINSALW